MLYQSLKESPCNSKSTEMLVRIFFEEKIRSQENREKINPNVLSMKRFLKNISVHWYIYSYLRPMNEKYATCHAIRDGTKNEKENGLTRKEKMKHNEQDGKCVL